MTDFPVLVCEQGIAIPFPDSKTPTLDSLEVTTDEAVLLPACRQRDKVLLQPPLPVFLGVEDLKSLIASEGNPSILPVATDMASGADKGRNEDFAVSAVFNYMDADPIDPVYFMCVADGVSTKTFWAERASRIAALQSYKTVRDCISQPNLTALDNDWLLNDFIPKLTRDIQAALAADRETLKANSNISPPQWSEQLYKQYFDRLEFWYSSTLVIFLSSPIGSFFLSTGDGGAWLDRKIKVVTKQKKGIWDQAKTDLVSNAKAVLESDDDVTVHNVISLDAPIGFSGGCVSFDENLSELDVFLSTDGYDRTRSWPNNKALDYPSIATGLPGSSDDLLKLLERAAVADHAEQDNMSLAGFRRYLGREVPKSQRVQLGEARTRIGKQFSPLTVGAFDGWYDLLGDLSTPKDGDDIASVDPETVSPEPNKADEGTPLVQPQKVTTEFNETPGTPTEPDESSAALKEHPAHEPDMLDQETK